MLYEVIASLLEQAAPQVQIYSIDEAFLQLEGPWLTDAMASYNFV